MIRRWYALMHAKAYSYRCGKMAVSWKRSSGLCRSSSTRDLMLGTLPRILSILVYCGRLKRTVRLSAVRANSPLQCGCAVNHACTSSRLWGVTMWGLGNSSSCSPSLNIKCPGAAHVARSRAPAADVSTGATRRSSSVAMTRNT
ncbi:ORF113 [Infectious spleen and kidney necrosis virus]|nr:ORF113 [Infectious spleen and kidney necrosis virus]